MKPLKILLFPGLWFLLFTGCTTLDAENPYLDDEIPSTSPVYSLYKEVFPLFGQEASGEALLSESSRGMVTNIAWWINQSEDTTQAIQMALDSEAKVILFPAKGSPWITRPLFVGSDKILLFEKGSILEAQRGAYKGKGENLLRAHESTNLIISGYGAVMRMHKKDYQSKDYDQGEWRHAISLLSCTDVIIEGLTILSSGGDGVYLGQSKNEAYKNYNENILLKDLYLGDHHRQGISVISIDGLRIKNVVVHGTDGTPPGAGIDIEPNRATEILKDILIEDSRFVANTGPGFLTALIRYTDESEPLDITVRNSTFDGKIFGIAVLWTGKKPRGSIVFENVETPDLKHIHRRKSLDIRFIEN